jgi:probable addiction module antidote protein
MAKAKKSKAQFQRFEASDFLKSEAAIEEFLAAAMEDPNPGVFLAALGEVAKMRGVATIPNSSDSNSS